MRMVNNFEEREFMDSYVHNKDVIIQEVEEKVRKELEGKVNSDMFGYVNIFEERKKELLKEYGIDYKTLQENNLGCCID